MPSLRKIFLVFSCPLFLVGFSPTFAVEIDPRLASLTNDIVMLKDGSEVRGLILRSSASSVLIETATKEIEIPKSNIRRIIDFDDNDEAETGVTPEGELPHWQNIVQDFLHHDSTKSFRQVPATAIDNGYLRNVPYLSFRINKKGELNIYGNPENPAAIELGVYGSDALQHKMRTIIREFIAGYLGTRKEISALYALNLDGGEATVGKFKIRVTPASSPDAYGGWWLSVYNPSLLESSRLSDKKYAKVTRPFNEVNDRDGSLRAQFDDSIIDDAQNIFSESFSWIPNIFRDKKGTIRPYEAPPTKKQD